MKKIMQFLAGVRKEAAKVKWPNKKEMIKYSIATLTIIFIFVIFFGALDLILSAIKMVIS